MIPFIKDYYPMICAWYENRNLDKPELCYLAPIGFIEKDVAAGFLIKTDIGIGILDSFISNPYSEKKVRDRALNEIACGLIDAGKRLGMSAIKFDTGIVPIKERALLTHGFRYITDVSLFIREI